MPVVGQILLCLTAFAYPALGLSFLYPPSPAKINNLWKDGPCAVRAWVRAEDLRQNQVINGELRVRLEQPCDQHVERVGLRLQLDEFMEVTTALGPELPMDYASWQQSAQSDWKTYKHNRTAFSTEGFFSDLGAEAILAIQTPAGLVQPFSIAMPDVRFPTGTFPLVFYAAQDPEEDRTSAIFGRAYRYVASISSSNGTREETAAGFRTFLPSPPPAASLSASPVTTETIAHPRRRELDDEPSECSSYLGEQQLPLSVHFPNGPVVVQGSSFDVDISTLEDAAGLEDTCTTLTAAYVATSLAGIDGRKWTTHFHELRTPFFNSIDRRSPNTVIAPGTSSRVSIHIPPHFATSAASGAHFTVGAYLQLELVRTYNVSLLQPEYLTESDFLPNDYGDGTEGWTYGECDRRYHRTQTFSARVPLELPSVVDGHYYLNEDGQVMPRVLLSSLESRMPWRNARPMIDEDETTGSHNVADFPWAVNDIQGFVGVYVGPLWEKSRKMISSADNEDPVVAQLVL